MDNKNDRRECFNFDEDEFANINRRRCSDEEEIDCHHRERDRFAEALEEAFNEGYKKGYCKGYEEGYEKGYAEGFKEGCREGRERAQQEVVNVIKKRRCCKCHRRCRCFRCC